MATIAARSSWRARRWVYAVLMKIQSVLGGRFNHYVLAVRRRRSGKQRRILDQHFLDEQARRQRMVRNRAPVVGRLERRRDFHRIDTRTQRRQFLVIARIV